MPAKPPVSDVWATILARAQTDPAFREALGAEAAELLQQGDLETARRLIQDEMAASLLRGLADAEAGRVTVAEDVRARLQAKYAATSSDAEREARLADLRRAVEEGVSSGPGIPAGQVFRELLARYQGSRPYTDDDYRESPSPEAD